MADVNPVAPKPGSYRPDIDGLRAVAVLGVVVYHIDETLVPGGFTGVDIFFVISGYLITQILRREITAGEFSLRNFYRRRLLRIGPAYFVVTVATLLAGSFVLLPGDLKSLAESAAWSALALPNVHFWLNLDTGYFATASNQVPLLHLWSLGVEEQFYLLWPLTLLLLGRWLGWRRALFCSVALIAISSFLLGEYTARTAPSFAYYMLPARAGELLVGGLLALRAPALAPGGRNPAMAELQVLLGFGLIAWGLFALDRESIFPGFNALYPTLGAALVIQAGTSAAPRLSAVLRLRPMVFIGLLSYSLYLWHWPILALMRYTTSALSPSMKLGALVLMLLASYASYRWVEVPFRHGRLSALVKRHSLATYASAVLVIFGAVFSLMLAADSRQAALVAAHEERLEALEDRMRAAFSYDYNCQTSSFKAALVRSSRCVVGDEDSISRNEPPALLVGDSNAAHYIGVLGAIAKSEKFAFRNLSVSSCPPLFARSKKYGKPSDRQGCSDYRAEIRRQTRRYPYVFLGAQWTFHSRVEGFEADLEATLKELGRFGATVVVLGQVPRFPSFNQNCELSRISDPAVTCKAAVNDGAIPAINKRLQVIAARHSHVHYMDVSEIICPGGGCSPYIAEAPIYFDAGHLSMAGSWDVGREMVSGQIPLPHVFRAIGAAGGGGAVHSISDIK